MPDFAADFATADAMFAEAFGADVTYHRGATQVTGSITAEPVIHNLEADEHAGTTTTLQYRDYLISVADLVIASVTIEPRAGDRIRETINGTLEEFQVMPLRDRPPAEHTDTSGTTWLVRTKYIGSV